MQTVQISKKNQTTAPVVVNKDDDSSGNSVIGNTSDISSTSNSDSKNDQNSNDPKKGQNPDPWSFDPWASDPWSSDDTSSNKTSDEPHLSPQERVTMITDVYKLVLGREPDNRDINYYKYSTLSKTEIINQLLEGKEHSRLIEDGNQFKNMKNRAEQAEIKSKVLENQVQDQINEFKELTNLLQEKNRQIHSMRTKMNNPYDFSDNARLALNMNKEKANSTYSGLNSSKTTLKNEVVESEGSIYTDQTNRSQLQFRSVHPVEHEKESFLMFILNKIKELIS